MSFVSLDGRLACFVCNGCVKLSSLLQSSFTQTIKARANFYNLYVEGSSIDSIHTAVLSSSHILDDKYLVRVLDIMKHPHKKEWAWFDRAKGAIEKKFKVKFPDNKKHFLYKISDHHFNNTFNQRMRRGMLQNVGGVWYERFTPKMTKMIFKK